MFFFASFAACFVLLHAVPNEEDTDALLADDKKAAIMVEHDEW